MCGIFAAIEHGRDLAGPRWRTDAVLAALGRRGPDARGHLEAKGPGWTACLAHTRLKIIDLSDRAAQPMASKDGRHVLVFNGEIYAFAALRAELAGRGHEFISASDTEVLLNALREWGEGALERIDGMFAFVLLDRRDGTLLAARDRLGVKPLYYRSAPGGVALASEVRAVRAATGAEFQPDAVAVASFVAFGSVSGPATAAAGVSELLPGNLLRFGPGGLEVRRYWSPVGREEGADTSFPQAAGEVRRRLARAVREQLVSDVPVGIFLSGGMDSGALVALAAEAGGANVDAFTIGFPQDGASHDESDGARDHAAQAGVRHHVVEVTEADALGSVDDWFAALDQPSIDGLNTFLVAKAVRRAGVTVALSGLGGDELFGGYAHLRRSARRPRPSPLAPALERLLAPGSVVWRLLAGRGGRLDKALAMLAARDAAAAYAASRALFVLPAVPDLVAPAHRARWCGGGNRSLLTSTSTRGEGVRAQILLELQNYLPNVLLRDSDVMAMWHGLEVRVPFLDQALVDYVVAVGPGDLSGRAGIKPLLAAALGHHARPQHRKLGFSLPMARWLRGPLRADVERRLGRLEWAGEFLTTKGALARWRRLLGGEDRAWTRVWAIYVLDRWLEREHRDGAPD